LNYKIDIENCEKHYQGFFTLEKYTLQHSLFEGGMSEPIEREMFHHGNAVAILLYDPKEDSVVFVEQFRIGVIEYGKGAWVYELVAGYQEEGESIEDVVRREVYEESGLTVMHIEPVMNYHVNPANTSDQIQLVYAHVDSRSAGGIHGLKDEGEDIKVHVVKYNEMNTLFTGGRLPSATPIIAMLWLQLNRDRLQSAHLC